MLPVAAAAYAPRRAACELARCRCCESGSMEAGAAAPPPADGVATVGRRRWRRPPPGDSDDYQAAGPAAGIESGGRRRRRTRRGFSGAAMSLLLVEFLFVIARAMDELVDSVAGTNATSRQCNRPLISRTELTVALFAPSEWMPIPYDNSITPINITLRPIDVGVELIIQDIPALSQDRGWFVSDVWVSQYWRDTRLRFGRIDPCRHNISLNWRLVRKLWTPNVCFVNSYASHIHSSPSPNILGVLSSDGGVWISHRTRVRGPCQMDLGNFPMDRQECSLVLESYSYNTAEIALRWLSKFNVSANRTESPVTFVKPYADYHIPEFQLVSYRVEHRVEVYTAGDWDQIVVVFTFQRTLGFYMLQAFAPTLLCIFMSWVGFFLPTSSVKARIMIGVMTISSLIYFMGNISSYGLPRASYMRALDVWNVGCMSFTFGALIELASASLVDVWLLQRAQKKAKLEAEAKPKSLAQLLAGEAGGGTTGEGGTCVRTMPALAPMAFIGQPIAIIRSPKLPANRGLSSSAAYDYDLETTYPSRYGEMMDCWSIVLFPLAFTAFSVFYWGHYYFADYWLRM